MGHYLLFLSRLKLQEKSQEFYAQINQSYLKWLKYIHFLSILCKRNFRSKWVVDGIFSSDFEVLPPSVVSYCWKLGGLFSAVTLLQTLWPRSTHSPLSCCTAQSSLFRQQLFCCKPVWLVFWGPSHPCFEGGTIYPIVCIFLKNGCDIHVKGRSSPLLAFW